VAVLGSVSYTLMTFAWFSHAAFLTPIVNTLELTDTQAGIIVGAIPFTYIVVSLLSGLVIDRIGPGLGIGIALAIVGTAQILRGLSNSFGTLLVATVILGIGGTGVTFGLPKLVSRLFPSRLLGSMSTVYVLGSFAGSALVFRTGRASLSPLLGGWKPVFVWTGVIVCGFSVIWTLLLRWHANTYPDRYEQSVGSTFTKSSFLSDIQRVVTHPGIRFLIVIGGMYLMMLHGLQGWLPRILEFRGMSDRIAGNITTIFIVGQVIGALVLPPISDRWDRYRELVIVCGLCVGAGVVGLLPDGSVTMAIVAVVVAGIGIGGVSPLIRAFPTRLDGIGAALTATAVSLIFTIGQVGGFAGPFVVGAFQDATGSFFYSLMVLIAGSLVMSLAGFGLPQTGE
jgi:cyanate permease